MAPRARVGAPGTSNLEPATATVPLEYARHDRHALDGRAAPVSRGRLLIGTCSWTDKTLIDAGTFYPPEAKTAEARLVYYASQFPIVEVDSSYYAIPAEQAAVRWVERTPADFLFDIKAYGLFTQHPARADRLPRDVLDALPAGLRGKRNLYYRDLPPELLDDLWQRFIVVLEVLRAAGKLGVVVFQFPPWFVIGRESRRHLERCRQILAEYELGVEFRGGRWLDPGNEAETFAVLRDLGCDYIAVDEPQFDSGSTPPVAEVTGPTALVRFHGRNHGTWRNTSGSPSDRFDYYYSDEELEEWVPKIHRMQELAEEVHLLMNTNKGDQGVVNARNLARVLGLHLPGL